MSQQINLDKLDVNGDVRENAEAAGFDRSTFLKTGAVGAVGVAGVFGLPSLANAAISTKRPSAKNDVKILQYALTLEYLEAAFYAAAVKQDNFASPELKQFAQVTANHEAQHVKDLKKAIGRSAVKSPTLDSTAVAAIIAPDAFGPTAALLEDTGVSAYAGQGPNLKQRAVVQVALAIHSVEARHAAWIRYILGGGAVGAKASSYPAPRAYDKAKTQGQILKAVTGLKGGGKTLITKADTSKF
ncbi:ferritin-like domain-containing protein [Patulibacter sp.]|uniref:ferritin-like domain-containing protein n=1 Tax=Patulibacter sp. TaxID=1912859 RepID=UPI0027262294|nr:ferritin-like domain-containing protein [Patulibacter sp.]MDO9406844.1 ferritin-like domain-containing protein [Patulibacter sp.]